MSRITRRPFSAGSRPAVVVAAPLLLLTALVACDRAPVEPDAATTAAVDGALTARGPHAEGPKSSPDDGFADFSAVDAALRLVGMEVRLGTVEYLTLGESGQVGRILFASDRGNKQLAFDWVPNDPRRGGAAELTYAVDVPDGAATGGLDAAVTEAAIDRAMATWTSVSCSESDLAVVKAASLGLDLGVVEAILAFGGLFGTTADISHAGWLPAAFFNSPPFFPPNGAEFILGVTFTAGFTDANGDFVDANGDGKLDTAFREIYYNNNFPWGIGTNFPIDVESVALHEAGHGLSQAHFGDIFLTEANGKLHFAPRAVMNAAYAGVLQALLGTDVAGHCSLWGNWPNR